MLGGNILDEEDMVTLDCLNKERKSCEPFEYSMLNLSYILCRIPLYQKWYCTTSWRQRDYGGPEGDCVWCAAQVLWFQVVTPILTRPHPPKEQTYLKRRSVNTVFGKRVIKYKPQRSKCWTKLNAPQVSHEIRYGKYKLLTEMNCIWN